MIRLLRWFLGYIDFSFSHGFVQGFVDDLFRLGINAKNVHSIENGVAGECGLGDYIKIKRLAKTHGGVVKIRKRHGLIFPLLSLRSRFSLVVGALCFVVIVCVMSGYIWQVDIAGNEKIPTTQLYEFLEKNGLEKGTSWRSVDRDYLESLIMSSFVDVSWVHINSQGSIARVEIRERVPKPRVYSQKGFYNVKATKDGIIVSNVAYEGWTVAKAGDSVVEGDLLISGVHKTDEKTNSAFAHARGEVLAKVETPFSLTINREQSYKVLAGNKYNKSLYFFGLVIPLNPFFKMPKDADVVSSEKYLRLNKKNLPLGVITKTYSYYDTQSVVLSDKELNKLINKEIERKIKSDFKENEIVSKSIAVSLNSHNAVAKGKLVVVEDIGKEVKVNKK